MGSEGLLSFRGAALEPQRFATHCGLPGSYLPGKRWTRKVAILQPVQLQSYVADCNTEDLICVLVEVGICDLSYALCPSIYLCLHFFEH